jgi:hypothetical protein
MLKNSQTNVMDAERSGRPSTSPTDEQEEATAIILAETRGVTMKKLHYNQDSVNVHTAYSLVHDILRLRKVPPSWVSKHLTEEHICNLQQICTTEKLITS